MALAFTVERSIKSLPSFPFAKQHSFVPSVCLGIRVGLEALTSDVLEHQNNLKSRKLFVHSVSVEAKEYFGVKYLGVG